MLEKENCNLQVTDEFSFSACSETSVSGTSKSADF
jgi:hypothetical protein